MKIGDGPAAVIGDERRLKPLTEKMQSAKCKVDFALLTLHFALYLSGRSVSRMNRESEDLPELHKKIGNFRGQKLPCMILG